MPLTPPTNPRTGLPWRERLLVYGGPKIGKTTIALQLAEIYQNTGTPAVFHYIDTDATLDPMMAGEFSHLKNINALSCWGWTEMRKAAKSAMQSHAPEDWIIVDMATKYWKEAQNHFSSIVHGEDDDDYLLKMRAEWTGTGKAPADIEGWDWGYVNMMYDRVMQPILFGARAHVLLICEQQDTSERDDSRVQQMFGVKGPKPSGQKGLAYQLNTILHYEKRGDGRYLTTKGDRGRERHMVLKQQKVTDLVQDYLIPVGGWTV